MIVYRELTNIGTPVAGAIEVQTLDWIQTRQAANRTMVETLRLEIDEGEAEAIALAIQLNGTIQNRLQSAANKAAAINLT